jgi:hypothetical protein
MPFDSRSRESDSAPLPWGLQSQVMLLNKFAIQGPIRNFESLLGLP